MDDVRTYWQSTTERFFIPSLSLRGRELNKKADEKFGFAVRLRFLVFLVDNSYS